MGFSVTSQPSFQNKAKLQIVLRALLITRSYWGHGADSLCSSPADRLGDGDWRFGAEGKPAVSADAVSQDHPGSVSGAAEEAGVPGVGCQRSGSQRLPRGSQAQVRRTTCTPLLEQRRNVNAIWIEYGKKRLNSSVYQCSRFACLCLLQFCWRNLGLGVFRLRIPRGNRTSQSIPPTHCKQISNYIHCYSYWRTRIQHLWGSFDFLISFFVNTKYNPNSNGLLKLN